MSWTDGFRTALLRYVQQNGHPEATRITYWDEEIDTGAFQGCESCGYGADEPYELTIYFETEDEDYGHYRSDRPFGELLDELIRQEI